MKNESPERRDVKKVAVVGCIGVDTNIYLESDTLEGETAFSQAVDCLGQAGGFTSAGFRSLGYEVSFIGYAGTDIYGDTVRQELDRLGVNRECLFDTGMGTDRSINIIFNTGKRKSFYSGKGHLVGCPDQKMCAGQFVSSGLVHFNIPDWSRHLLPLARESGCVVSCDLQDIVSVDDPYRRDFIEQSDILFFSSVNDPDYNRTFDRFLEINDQLTLITGLGEQGCAWHTHDSRGRMPAVSLGLPFADAVGAGDSLAVGFLSSYCLDGYSLLDSIVRGQIAARYCCSLRGMVGGLITHDRLDDFFTVVKDVRV